MKYTQLLQKIELFCALASVRLETLATYRGDKPLAWYSKKPEREPSIEEIQRQRKKEWKKWEKEHAKEVGLELSQEKGGLPPAAKKIDWPQREKELLEEVAKEKALLPKEKKERAQSISDALKEQREKIKQLLEMNRKLQGE